MNSLPHANHLARVLLMATLISIPGLVSGQKLDQNGNGMSDVWEQIYSPSVALPPEGDADGDGVSNGKEALAGTDPWDANSVPRIPTFSLAGGVFSVTVPCALGKQYQLQSLEPTNGVPWTNWSVEDTRVARDGTEITLSAGAGSSSRLFRIGISDVDSDGDGLNDWEEYQLGLDPNKSASNGQLDSQGRALNDSAYAISRFASQDQVFITATDDSAVEPDPGQKAGDLGQYTVTRGGFPLNTIQVNLALGGPGAGFATNGVDHAALPTSVILSPGMTFTNITLKPLANTNLLKPVVAMLKVTAGAGYTIGGASNAGVVIYPSPRANGTGLTGQYFTNSSSTYGSSLNFNPANLRLTRVDTNIDFTWGPSSQPILNNNGHYCVRWTGQVQPEYSETYYFVANTDDGVKLWVNDQLIIDSWKTKSASDVTGTIYLQGGVRYDIKMEYFQNTSAAVAHLSWYSPSQGKQIIPMNRLYPNSTAPTAVVSPNVAFGFLNQPFSFAVAGANQASHYTANSLPPGLILNAGTGLISGTPTLAGVYDVMLTASNTVGVSGSTLAITIFDTGSSVVREVWTNVPGTTIASIPVDSPPSSVAALGSLEGITDYGDNYAERIRGFITIPETGNYHFWIAGSDAAELWISNDSEPVNKVRRAYVEPTPNGAPPPANGTASRQWNSQATQESGWLSLVAGQKYYIEILHKAGVGAGDNWAVGGLLDATGTNTTPGGLIPGYLLSPYYPPPNSVAPGTLYVANMLPGEGVTNMPVGTATLRLSADDSKAILNFSFSGISSTVIGEHIDSDPYLSSPSQTMYDISAAAPQPDGSYSWFIKPVGTLSVADVLEILDTGKAYITILTDEHPNGELIGHFARALGSTSFTNPPPPAAWADDHTDINAAVRFLNQATFGASPGDITAVQLLGYTNWLQNQFAMPATHHLSLLISNASADPTLMYSGNTVFNDWWQRSVTAPDQLRQRVAFALSEIMVVSDQGVLKDNGLALSSYYDTLLDNAFGNFRSLLEAVSLTPAMGLYLNMKGNDKGSLINGTHANENYAREIMQLFSIGLYRTWPDGSLVMTSTGDLVPTYDQNVIMGFAAAFTGWNYYQANQANGRLPTKFTPPANYTNSMVLVPTHHDLNAKLVLDNVVLPPAIGSAADPGSPDFDAYCAGNLEQALDSIFNNQNVGPFICRQLIQRLVTSSPSPGYIYRVAQVFNDNGQGVRGDMQSVIQAILLDPEARSTEMLAVPTYGKQREPLLRITAAARAFPGPSPITGSYTEPTNQTLYVTTGSAHRLTSGETVSLSFTDTAGQPEPASQPYSVTVTSPTKFTATAQGISSGSYTQKPSSVISNMVTHAEIMTNIITVSISGHGLKPGNPVYLDFYTGGAADGVYQVINTTNTGSFTVIAQNAEIHSGKCLIPKISYGGFVVSTKTNLTFSTATSSKAPLPHGLSPGDDVYISFTKAGSPASGQYEVVSTPDASHFTINVTGVNNQTRNGAVVYPLVAPRFARAGNVSVSWSTWLLNATDTGGTYSLAQSPLNSPTVFNFFFPDYKFPGILEEAGLTTPEFQLTSDTSVMFQMNFTEAGLLVNSSTNGLSSFSSSGNGNGGIVIDLSPWMTPTYTANVRIPVLISLLNSRLCAGQLTSASSNVIYNFVANNTNFPYTTPTPTQVRDRTRAVVHLILCSPDYAIQR